MYSNNNNNNNDNHNDNNNNSNDDDDSLTSTYKRKIEYIEIETFKINAEGEVIKKKIKVDKEKYLESKNSEENNNNVNSKEQQQQEQEGSNSILYKHVKDFNDNEHILQDEQIKKQQYNIEQDKLQQQQHLSDFIANLKSKNYEQHKSIEQLESRIKDLERKLKSTKTHFEGIEPMFSLNLNFIESSKLPELERFLFGFFNNRYSNRLKQQHQHQTANSMEIGEIDKVKELMKSNMSHYYDDGFIMNKNGNSEFGDMETSIPYNFSRMPIYQTDKPDLHIEVDKNDLVPPDEESKFQGICFNCSQKGHSVNDCPYSYNHKRVQQNRRTFIENKPVNERYYLTIERQTEIEKRDNERKLKVQQSQTTSQQQQPTPSQQQQQPPPPSPPPPPSSSLSTSPPSPPPQSPTPTTTTTTTTTSTSTTQPIINKPQFQAFEDGLSTKIEFDPSKNKQLFVQNTKSTPITKTTSTGDDNTADSNKFQENDDYIEFPKDLFEQTENRETEESFYKHYDPDFFKNFITTKYSDHHDIKYVSRESSYMDRRNRDYNSYGCGSYRDGYRDSSSRDRDNNKSSTMDDNNHNNSNNNHNNNSERSRNNDRYRDFDNSNAGYSNYGYNNNSNGHIGYNNGYGNYNNYNNNYGGNGYNNNYNNNYNNHQYNNNQYSNQYNNNSQYNNNQYNNNYNNQMNIVSPPRPPKLPQQFGSPTSTSPQIQPQQSTAAETTPPRLQQSISRSSSTTSTKSTITSSTSSNITNSTDEDVSDMDIEDGECK